jgi:hypothetical protein
MGQQFVEAIGGMILDAPKHIDQVVLEVRPVLLAGLQEGGRMARVWPPFSEPVKSQFLWLTHTLRRTRSPRLLSGSRRPSSVKRIRASQ